ncbi:MAG: acyl transferase [Chitinophagaceae bacterium]
MQVEWYHKIFSTGKQDFDSLALEIFRYQAAENEVYRSYLAALKVDPANIHEVDKIPFLPIRFFKSHKVVSGSFEPVAVFESSGTTGSINSRHFISDISLYEQSFIKGFELFYGPAKDWCIIGLLPSYLERKNASLVYMVDQLIKLSGHSQSGFYLDAQEQLVQTLSGLEEQKQKTLLIGVTFALLDFAEKFSLPLKYTTIMETGGMKGRKQEMVREEVHGILKNSFGVKAVHSEYGMTELLSQAYSKNRGIFNCPPWMKIVLRDEEDPFLLKSTGTGVINVIDFANIHSSSFIATDDAGRLYDDGSFEIIGRMDGSDLRGCNLMVV